MKPVIYSLSFITLLFLSCQKEETETTVHCDIQKVYKENASKVSITNGIWGTVAFMEGNCMPIVLPSTSTCKTCPVKRTVRIYKYTTLSQAVPQNGLNFFDSFSTQLVKEFETDDNGFFQTDLAPGNYSIVVLENEKLYAFGFDGQGGISPLNFTGGKLNVSLTLNYKAVF